MENAPGLKYPSPFLLTMTLALLHHSLFPKSLCRRSHNEDIQQPYIHLSPAHSSSRVYTTVIKPPEQRGMWRLCARFQLHEMH